jgi:hypothetical protein
MHSRAAGRARLCAARCVASVRCRRGVPGQRRGDRPGHYRGEELQQGGAGKGARGEIVASG